MYSVTVTFKITEQVEQWIWTNFCVKLEHSSVETIWMTQKAAGLGNWWLAASSQQCTCSCISSCVVFWRNIKPPKCLGPPTAWIWCSATSGFSQNQNCLWKARDFRPLMRFRKIQWGSWWWLGELCEIPRCLLWKGLCPMYNVLISNIFFNKCLYFSYYMAGYLLDRPHMTV